MSEKISGKKKYIILVTAIVIFGLLLVGGTYAYQLISASITNGSYDIVSACFDIDYDEGEAITGTLFQSSGPKGGLSGEVTMNIMSDCSLTGIGTITLHVQDGTDSILLSEGALKYAVYDDIDAEPLSEGVITYVGDIDIYSNFELTWEPVTYYIYIWLDGNIADNEYVNASFDGYIGASAENVMPGSVVTVNFDTQGGIVSTDYTTVGESVFTAPYSGAYKLEVWGAQGGLSSGGYGGYSMGIVELLSDNNIYINVGGSGLENSGGTGGVGGYNGGGTGGNGYNLNYDGGGGGGGATHIATLSGELSTLASSVNDILIVAGGGGGGNAWNATYTGGSGGGFSGVSGKTYSIGSIYGGTQTSGSAFGKGADGIAKQTAADYGAQGSGGGGGGYYGGFTATTGTGSNGGGGGGSGYIGNNLLTDKAMYCYNCETSNDTNTLTYSTTNVAATPTSQYAKSGDGAAKITALSFSKEVTYGDLYGDLPVPRKLGSIFQGWYTSPNGGTKITSDTVIKNRDDHTLYAVWESTTVYLFNEGDQCTDITGGWTDDGNTTDTVLSGEYWYAPSTYGATISTNNMIDFTNFTTLYVNRTYADGTMAVNVNTTSAWGTAAYSTSAELIALDVSEVTGEHYVWLSAASSSGYKVDKIWLE